jgi:phosphatidylglycerophosphate synthase
MPRPGPVEFFKQSLKSEAYYADEIINIYLLRPLAAVIVWILYPTKVTPNQVTIAAIVLGCAAAVAYAVHTPSAVILAGCLVSAKDIVDDADGQLARAKQLYSRRGRFLDSIGDFVVDVAIFAAITYALLPAHPGLPTLLLGATGLLGITVRVSYHVYYQASFLHLEQRYGLNRIVETVTEEDLRGDPIALRLQRLFNLIYTWQDKLIVRIDQWCRGTRMGEEHAARWYGDRAGLRLSGLMGFGTEFALLTACSITDALYLYLLLNLLLMNGLLVTSILYRRFLLRHALPQR